jgi:hypothetical protein
MGTTIGTRFVNDGLVFHYDMGNEKSFIGAPTVNYMNVWHPKTDPGRTYTPYVANTLPYLWANNHADAIQATSFMTGSALAQMVNSGVTDWGNTHHCIWTYDSELNEPVLTMRNYDNYQWKAFSGDHGLNFSAMGLTTGDYYTYSYDLWTTDLGYRPDPGLYSRAANTVPAFYDGLGGSAPDALPLKTGEWHRRWCSFQISANHDVTQAYTAFYWYGYNYINNQVMKIRRPQLELKKNYASSFTLAPRTNANSLIDLTGNHTVNVANCGFANTNIFYFTGSASANGIIVDVKSSYQSVSNNTPRSWEAIIRPDAYTDNAGVFGLQHGLGCSYMCNGGIAIWGGVYSISWYDDSAYQFLSGAEATVGGRHVHVVGTWDPTDYKVRIYINGALRATSGQTNMRYNGTSPHMIIGFLGAGGFPFAGRVPVARYYYGKCLTADEVTHNFSGLRARFGI